MSGPWTKLKARFGGQEWSRDRALLASVEWLERQPHGRRFTVVEMRLGKLVCLQWVLEAAADAGLVREVGHVRWGRRRLREWEKV